MKERVCMFRVEGGVSEARPISAPSPLTMRPAQWEAQQNWQPSQSFSLAATSHLCSASAGATAPACGAVTSREGLRHPSTGVHPCSGLFRGFSTAPPTDQPGSTSGEASQEQKSDGAAESRAEASTEEAPSVEDLQAQLDAKEAKVQKLAEEVAQMTDSLKRALAEMENVRQRTAREMDNAKKFAVQGFVKSILDVADNLERAAASVPADALAEEPGKELSTEQLRKLLRGLQEGVGATERILLQVLKSNNVEQYNPLNQQFDPNLHNALFELPDASKEPGTVGAVTKRGYKLFDRVIRPAEVGVVRAP
ncbi:GrpE protein homolog, partial [Haematococcus lacustris]